MSSPWWVVLGVGLVLVGVVCEIVGATVRRRRYGWPVVAPSASGSPADRWRLELSCARAGTACGALLLVVLGIRSLLAG